MDDKVTRETVRRMLGSGGGLFPKHYFPNRLLSYVIPFQINFVDINLLREWGWFYDRVTSLLWWATLQATMVWMYIVRVIDGFTYCEDCEMVVKAHVRKLTISIPGEIPLFHKVSCGECGKEISAFPSRNLMGAITLMDSSK